MIGHRRETFLGQKSAGPRNCQATEIGVVGEVGVLGHPDDQSAWNKIVFREFLTQSPCVNGDFAEWKVGLKEVREVRFSGSGKA